MKYIADSRIPASI